MPASKEYTKTLDRLASLLKRKPMTASAIAEALDCCKPAAYSRLRALQKRGDAVYAVAPPKLPKGQGKPGPRSTTYGIT